MFSAVSAAVLYLLHFVSRGVQQSERLRSPLDPSGACDGASAGTNRASKAFDFACDIIAANIVSSYLPVDAKQPKVSAIRICPRELADQSA